jgi:hypothetical protein
MLWEESPPTDSAQPCNHPFHRRAPSNADGFDASSPAEMADGESQSLESSTQSLTSPWSPMPLDRIWLFLQDFSIWVGASEDTMTVPAESCYCMRASQWPGADRNKRRWMEQEDINVYSTNELGLETEYALPGCSRR